MSRSVLTLARAALAVALLLAPAVHAPVQAQALDESFQPWVRDIQQKLKDLNFYRGPVDGIIGPGTKRAAFEYRKARNLPLTETLDLALLQELTFATNQPRQTVAAVPAPTARPAGNAIVSEAQVHLKALGLYDGPTNGTATPETVAAVRLFRAQKNMAPGVEINNDLLTALVAARVAKTNAGTPATLTPPPAVAPAAVEPAPAGEDRKTESDAEREARIRGANTGG